MSAPTTRRDGRETPPKATLFCPDCDHRSHVDGDWMTLTTLDTTRYRCPDCGTTVAERPATADGPADCLRLWRDNLETWQSIWWRSVLP